MFLSESLYYYLSYVVTVANCSLTVQLHGRRYPTAVAGDPGLRGFQPDEVAEDYLRGR